MIRKIAPIAMAVAGLMAQCGPTKQPPVPGRVFLAGDSTAFLANYYSGGFGYDEVHVALGTEAHHTRDDIDAAVADDQRSPAVEVLIYAHNYVDTAFNDADRASMEGHVDAVHDDACTVIVLPAYTGSDVRHALVIFAFRDWARDYAAADPAHRVVADWPSVAEQHPEWFDDGVHAHNADAAHAMLDVVAEGVEACS